MSEDTEAVEYSKRRNLNRGYMKLILIIEDDPTMLEALKGNFEFVGYRVRTANDGKKGLKAALDFKPDLILLDVMLPEVNGYEICRRLRQSGFAAPIIMLTAKGQESDIVRGLDLGADDYVTKPFSIDVLLARVKARLREHPEEGTGHCAFGDCRLDREAHKLFRAGEEVDLTPKEYRLLAYFVKNAGRALTRDKILDDVWGEDLIVTQRSVNRCINTLRNKIEADPQRPVFIKTIRDVGYRFDVQ
ncbi:MAG: response regulator transcription factor [Verrucomicrobia bacterium]|nr:response regulator transcription factor [Verrucomicrobiota bacterium]